MIPAGKSPAVVEQAHICPACALPLVQPVDWLVLGAERWLVGLRCANCRRTDDVLLSERELERFGEQLERGRRTLVEGLARVTRANVHDYQWRFAAALAADAVLPDDFLVDAL
jgi:hypothetical protein